MIEKGDEVRAEKLDSPFTLVRRGIVERVIRHRSGGVTYEVYDKFDPWRHVNRFDESEVTAL